MKEKNGKKEVDYKKRAGVYGMLLVFCAFICFGFLVKTIFLNDTNKNIPSETEKPTVEEKIDEETENTSTPAEQPSKPEEQQNNNLPKIQDRSTIKEINEEITYEIPQGILDRIDMEKFDKAFSEYCKNNSLLTYGTVAKSNMCMTENFSMGYIAFDLKLNNYNDTTVECVLSKDGEYGFSHF